MEEVYAAANKELKSNNDFVIASVVRTSGSTPQKPGAKLLVKLDDTSVGTLGGGCVEGDIWFASKEILKRGGSSMGISKLAKFGCEQWMLDPEGNQFLILVPYLSKGSDKEALM